METKEKHFSCCERVLMSTVEVLRLPEFQRYVKLASGFGGGVSGRGSICGAVSGGIMAFDLRYGTDGTEEYEEFIEKRLVLRKIAQQFMRDFENEFGAVNCSDLLGNDPWTEDGKARIKELRKAGKTYCTEYVDWASKRVCQLLE